MTADAARRQGAKGGRPRGSSARHSAVQDRRTALLRAAARLVAERGTDELSREAICAIAGMPPSDFDAVFAGRVDCLVAVFDDAADRCYARMRAAYGAVESWLDGIRGAHYALLSFLDENTGLARFMVVDSLAGEPAILARRQRLLAQLARALDCGRPAQAAGAQSAPFGADAVVGAVAAVIHGRLQEESVPCLRDLGGSLMAVLVLPYLGVDAARGELSRPAPRVLADEGAKQQSDQDAAASVGLRVTPRTLRVLRAIAINPGINNRQVAEVAGISGSSQASRMLARLLRLGLIVSEPKQAGSGRAWKLTSTGRWVFAEVGSGMGTD
jgi:DNA-binding MarR family transcriptional regulator